MLRRKRPMSRRRERRATSGALQQFRRELKQQISSPIRGSSSSSLTCFTVDRRKNMRQECAFDWANVQNLRWMAAVVFSSQKRRLSGKRWLYFASQFSSVWMGKAVSPLSTSNTTKTASQKRINRSSFCESRRFIAGSNVKIVLVGNFFLGCFRGSK